MITWVITESNSLQQGQHIKIVIIHICLIFIVSQNRCVKISFKINSKLDKTLKPYIFQKVLVFISQSAGCGSLWSLSNDEIGFIEVHTTSLPHPNQKFKILY